METKLFYLVLLLNVYIGQSQITFERTYKGWYTSSVVQTADEGYIFTGTDQDDIFLIGRLNKYGKLLWRKNFGGYGYNLGATVISTQDNKFIAVGDYEDTISYGNYIHYSLVIKFDINGGILFQKKFGNPEQRKYTSSVIETAEGGYLVMSNSDDITSSPFSNLSFTKFNSTGDSLWNKNYKGEYQTYSLVRAADKSIALTGISQDSLLLMKITESGDSIWAKRYYASDGTSLVALKDSGFLIGNWDGDITRVNKKGEILWTKSYEDWGYWYPGNLYWKIIPTKDNNFVTAGTGYYNYDNSDVSAAILIKFKLNGDTLWTRYYDDSLHYTKCYDVQQTKDNGFILAGKAYDTSYTPLDTALLFIKTDSAGIIYHISKPSICLVTVDPVLSKNKIIWERTKSKGIEKYVVFRKEGLKWKAQADIPYDSLSVYNDITSDPNSFHYQYAIAAVNWNGDTTKISPSIETILLQSNQGTNGYANLSWNQYLDESGTFIPEYYYIYSGKTKTSLTILDSISGSTTVPSYNDTSYVGGLMYYQIRFKKATCAPAVLKSESGPYTQSLSNIIEYKVAKNKDINELSAFIYPNPVSSSFNLSFVNPSNGMIKVDIVDALGKVIFENNYANQPAGRCDFQLDAEKCNLTVGNNYIRIISADKISLLRCQCIK